MNKSDQEIEIEMLRRIIKRRDRQLERLQNYWVRAAKEAMNGDMRGLRLQVALAEAEPVEVVLSDGAP